MKRISVIIPPGMEDDIQRILDAENITFSQLLRNLVLNYLKGL